VQQLRRPPDSARRATGQASKTKTVCVSERGANRWQHHAKTIGNAGLSTSDTVHVVAVVTLSLGPNPASFIMDSIEVFLVHVPLEHSVLVRVFLYAMTNTGPRPPNRVWVGRLAFDISALRSAALQRACVLK
jgi:hypothetical protein